MANIYIDNLEIIIIIATRPDLWFAVTKFFQYLAIPSKNHMLMVKDVSR